MWVAPNGFSSVDASSKSAYLFSLGAIISVSGPQYISISGCHTSGLPYENPNVFRPILS